MSELLIKLAEHGINAPRGAGFRHGDNYTTCPRCSDQRKGGNKIKPCLSVKIDDNGGAVWNCHHCGWTGNVPSAAYSKAARAEMREPPRRPPPPAATPRPDAFFKFFEDRGIAREVVEEMGIYRGSHFFPQCGQEKPCIVFPYVKGGELVNNKYRSAQKDFAQDKGAERSLFNFDQIADDVLIWCEGEMDVLACMTAGYRSVTTLPDGAPNKEKEEDDPRREHDKRFEALSAAADRLKSVKKVIVAADGDGPGSILAEEIARRLGKDRCWRVRYPAGCKDANEVLVRYGVAALQGMIEKAKPYPVKGVYTVDDYLGKVLDLYRGHIQHGLTTGFPRLDEHMKLTGSGHLIIVTGIPNHGKSEFLDQIMLNYCRLHNWSVGYCSFENRPERHLAKFAEKILEKPFRKYDWSTVTPMDEADLEMAMEWAAEHIYFIRADDEAPTPEWILEKARDLVVRYGIKALVIDPYNEIEHRRQPGMTETEYLSQLLGKFRRFGEHHAVDVFFVAHPTKLQKTEGMEPIPDLYDISGGAHWNNKADFGFSVWRDKANPKAPVLVKIHKVRDKDLGKAGEVDFDYHRLTGTYTEAIG